MTLAVWQRTIVDDAGTVQAGASVEVRLESTGNLATGLKSDAAGVGGLSNPFTAQGVSDPSPGLASFYAAGVGPLGYKVTATKGGFTITWRNVLLGTAAGFDLDATRPVLTANRTYWFRPDGSDLLNDGLTDSAGGAFLTPQKGFDTLLTLDGGGFSGNVQAGGSGVRTFTGGVLLTSPFVGFSSISLVGDNTTPANCVIQRATGNCIDVRNQTNLNIRGFQLGVTGFGYGIVSSSRAIVTINGLMRFAACPQSAHMWANTGDIIYNGAAYTIAGNSLFHWLALNGGTISNGFSPNVITCSGTPAFSTFAHSSVLSSINPFGTTFSGAATGKRYAAAANAVIYTQGAGANFLPGNIAGTEESGGRYI